MISPGAQVAGPLDHVLPGGGAVVTQVVHTLS
jgi:hypothetical protein